MNVVMLCYPGRFYFGMYDRNRLFRRVCKKVQLLTGADIIRHENEKQELCM